MDQKQTVSRAAALTIKRVMNTEKTGKVQATRVMLPIDKMRSTA
jgi:hypothetical protein